MHYAHPVYPEMCNVFCNNISPLAIVGEKHTCLKHGESLEIGLKGSMVFLKRCKKCLKEKQ